MEEKESKMEKSARKSFDNDVRCKGAAASIFPPPPPPPPLPPPPSLRRTKSEPSLCKTRGRSMTTTNGAKQRQIQQSLRKTMDVDEPSGVLPVDVDVVTTGTRSPGSGDGDIKRHQRSSRVLQMQNQTLDWQLSKHSVLQRNEHLLDTGLWNDCQFLVGLPPNSVRRFKCHKMILAAASPVFEAMFFGGLAAATASGGGDSEDDDQLVKILDVQPDAFHVMLQYIYTDSINLTSFELVCDVCYASKKYMLPTLVEECTKYLWRDLYPKNACRAYEFAKLFDEEVLMDKGLQIIQTQTKEILSESTFEEVEHTTLVIILSQDSVNADENALFDAIVRWAVKECGRRGLESTGEKKRQVLGEALFLIRYLTFTPSEFAAGPARSDLLTQEESFAILMNISAPGSWNLPDYLSSKGPRQVPSELLPPPTTDMDMSTRYWCKRPMMQEPHCLNTSILDCSVTFVVDKDMCVHGIQVPSQASEVPDGLELGNEYNELLYAHLLDADGNRLTYTHFTAKVGRNAMIEITFNRSVYIKAGKVYRVGMVLNKVGWYPMGVCTRRVNCEGCLFTFCVGQPTDTQRDGLIRSIIFSK